MHCCVSRFSTSSPLARLISFEPVPYLWLRSEAEPGIVLWTMDNGGQDPSGEDESSKIGKFKKEAVAKQLRLHRPDGALGILLHHPESAAIITSAAPLAGWELAVHREGPSAVESASIGKRGRR
ncbi:hypothetical protein THAOC_08672 [Thalassiosira oceanica]|uniref:Uncharacterized protein n=1 Tax=Thalassiosira oceanica TaxID=159749 RepID=K0SYE7_THAOC|nr:hypothetical protein THAOC_08672 [Thalassiosira oceanica]|eukprot:EJK70009.1 hypothetical protein THAOC_08672 [Thalassiosira oceanica]